MLDVQKERLRHMMASAILELWKKETGSLASVFIEATVCITSCNSRMTVIQLSDHFPGLIPEPPMSSEKFPHVIQRPGNEAIKTVARQCHLTEQKRKFGEHCHDTTTDSSRTGWLSGTLEVPRDKSKESSTTSADLQQNQHLFMDSNNNQTTAPIDGDYSEGTDKDDMSSDESDVCEGAASDMEDASPSAPSSGVGSVIPGTGYYTYNKTHCTNKDTVKADVNDSGIQDMSTESLVIDMSSIEDECSSNNPIADNKGKSTNAKWSHSNMSLENGNGQGNGTVDFSQLDADLVISTPQNYTEQVRDVIRNRLLNGKQKAIGSKCFGNDHSGDYFPISASVSNPPKSNDVQAMALCRPYDVHTWSTMIKRESKAGGPGVLLDSRMLPQHFSPPALPLVPLRKNFLDAVTASAMPLSHPSLHKLFGLTNATDSSESKVFSDSLKEQEADDKQKGYSGMSMQFPDQKIVKFDGVTDGPANSEQKTYKCGFCNKTFLFKSKYHEHLPVHTSARPFECHMCTRTYKYKYDLRVHLRTHLGIPTKSTICPFCSGKFLTNKLLRHHIKEVHREQQQISEEQCAQSLDNVPSLSPATTSSI